MNDFSNLVSWGSFGNLVIRRQQIIGFILIKIKLGIVVTCKSKYRLIASEIA